MKLGEFPIGCMVKFKYSSYKYVVLPVEGLISEVPSLQGPDKVALLCLADLNIYCSPKQSDDFALVTDYAT